MKVLVACECSGVVAKAFRERGHEAWSCDLKPSELGEWHIHGDVRCWLEQGCWDLMIAHPECTHLCVSGARHFAAKRADGRQQAAIDFFMLFANANIPRIAIENPVGIMSTNYRKPDQIIQPWQFGHGETKATCLWLKGLPTLKPTKIVEGRDNRIHRMPPGPNRATERSRTYQGAMIVAKKKKADVQDERIPSALWRGLKGLLVHNVGELKTLLDLIPDDVAVAFSEFGGLRVCVSNNVIGAPSLPYVCFEELDDAEEYDDEDVE